MAHPPFVALHGWFAPEVTPLEYLTRVLLSLVAFGGVAVLVFLGSAAVDAVRSGTAAGRDAEADERRTDATRD